MDQKQIKTHINSYKDVKKLTVNLQKFETSKRN